MGKIGFLTLLNREDSKLSPHFGKAKWVAVVDTANDSCEFIQNKELNGRAVVEILKQNGCEDAVFSGIGEGALRQLKSARIYGWTAPQDVPLPKLREMYMRGELRHARTAMGCEKGMHTHGKTRRSAQL